jgi:hypothetical protein
VTDFRQIPPRTDAEWARNTERRLRLLESPRSLRIGPWVIGTVDGRLVASKAGDEQLEVGQAAPEPTLVDLSRGYVLNEERVTEAVTGEPGPLDRIGDYLTEKWNELVNAGTSAGTANTGLQATIDNIFRAVFGGTSTGNPLESVLTSLQKGWAEFWDGLNGTTGTASKLPSDVRVAGAAVRSTAGTGVTNAATAQAGVQSTVDQIWQAIFGGSQTSNPLGSIVTSLQKGWADFWDGLNGTTGTSSKLPGDVRTAAAGVRSTASTGVTNAATAQAGVQTTVDGIWQSIFGGTQTSNPLASVVTSLQKGWAEFWDGLNGSTGTAAKLPGDVRTAGAAVRSTANTGVTNAATADAKAVTADGKAVTADGKAVAASTNLQTTVDNIFRSVFGGSSTGNTFASVMTSLQQGWADFWDGLNGTTGTTAKLPSDVRVAGAAVRSTANTGVTNAATADGKAVTAQTNLQTTVDNIYRSVFGGSSTNNTFASVMTSLQKGWAEFWDGLNGTTGTASKLPSDVRTAGAAVRSTANTGVANAATADAKAVAAQTKADQAAAALQANILSGANLAYDGGFEDAFLWNPLPGATNADSWSTEQAHSGSRSLKFIMAGATKLLQLHNKPDRTRVEWPTDSTRKYYAEMWVYAPASNVLTTGYISIHSQVRLVGDTFSYPNVQLTNMSVTLTKGQWQKVSGTLVMPANAVSWYVYLRMDAACNVGDVFYLDDARVVDITDAYDAKAAADAAAASAQATVDNIHQAIQGGTATGNSTASVKTNFASAWAKFWDGLNGTSGTASKLPSDVQTAGAAVRSTANTGVTNAATADGKAVTAQTNLQTTVDNIYRSVFGGSSTNNTFASVMTSLQQGWADFWDGLNGSSGSTSKLPSDVRTAASAVRSTANTGVTNAATADAKAVTADGKAVTADGKAVTVTTNLQTTVDNIVQAILGGSSTNNTFAAVKTNLQNAWSNFWDGLNGSTGSTGKLPSDVQTAASAVRSTANTGVTNAATADGKAGVAQSVTQQLLQAGANLVPNPSWENANFFFSGTGSVSTEQKRSGTKSLKITATGAHTATDLFVNNTGTYKVKAEAGEVYYVEFWLWGDSLVSSGQAGLYATIFNPDGSFLQWGDLVLTTLTTANRSVWTKYTGFITIPNTPNAASFTVSASVRSDVPAGRVIHFDDIVVREVTEGNIAKTNAATAQGTANTATTNLQTTVDNIYKSVFGGSSTGNTFASVVTSLQKGWAEFWDGLNGTSGTASKLPSDVRVAGAAVRSTANTGVTNAATADAKAVTADGKAVTADGKAVTVTTNLQTTVDNIVQAVLGGSSTGNAFTAVKTNLQNAWSSFWDGLNGSSGSTGKLPADVQTAASAVRSTANTGVTNAATADAKAVTADGKAVTADGKAVIAQGLSSTAQAAGTNLLSNFGFENVNIVPSAGTLSTEQAYQGTRSWKWTVTGANYPAPFNASATSGRVNFPVASNDSFYMEMWVFPASGNSTVATGDTFRPYLRCDDPAGNQLSTPGLTVDTRTLTKGQWNKISATLNVGNFPAVSTGYMSLYFAATETGNAFYIDNAALYRITEGYVADGKAVAAQSTANTGVTNAATADGKAVTAQTNLQTTVDNIYRSVFGGSSTNNTFASVMTSLQQGWAEFWDGLNGTSGTASKLPSDVRVAGAAVRSTANTGVTNAATADAKAVTADGKAVTADGKAVTVTTNLQTTVDNIVQAVLGGSSTNNTFAAVKTNLQTAWSNFWDGLNGSSGSTGKLPSDVRTAASAVRSTANTGVTNAATADAKAVTADGKAVTADGKAVVAQSQASSSNKAGSNLCRNPGFEDLTFYNNSLYSTEQKRSGTRSLKLTGTGSTNVEAWATIDNTGIVFIPATQGDVFYMEFWIYGKSTNVGGGNIQMFMSVYDTAGVGLTYPSVTITGATTALNGVWTKYSATTSAMPANTANMHVRFRLQTGVPATDSYYFDDVVVREITEGSVARTNAAAAQSTANTGVTNAATADAKAVTADGKAVTADGKAVTADGKAVTAQGTANTATTNLQTTVDNIYRAVFGGSSTNNTFASVMTSLQKGWAEFWDGLNGTSGTSSKLPSDVRVAGAAVRSTANTGVTNAATADAKAVTADGKAVTADGKAVTADGKAVTAQTTANTATTNLQTVVDGTVQAVDGGSATGAAASTFKTKLLLAWSKIYDGLNGSTGSTTRLPGDAYTAGAAVRSTANTASSTASTATTNNGLLVDNVTSAFTGITAAGRSVADALSAMVQAQNTMSGHTRQIQELQAAKQSAAAKGVSFNLDFGTYAAGALPAAFTVTYSGHASATSTIGITNGQACWRTMNNFDRDAKVIYSTATNTDFQVLRGTMDVPPEWNLSGGTPKFSAIGRVSADGNSYVWARGYSDGFLSYKGELGCTVNGVETVWASNVSLGWNLDMTLVCGVGTNARQYQVWAGSTLVREHTEVGTVSQLGSGFRKFGVIAQVRTNSSGTPAHSGKLGGAFISDNEAPTVVGSTARMDRTGTGTASFAGANAITGLPNSFFDTIEYESPDIDANTSDGTFTVRDSKTYIVSGRVKINAALYSWAHLILQVYRAGSWQTLDWGNSLYPDGTPVGISGTWVRYLNAGEKVRLATRQGGATVSILTGEATGNETYFSITSAGD